MSNQARIKFAVCSEIFKGWAIEDTIAYASRIGYDAVEIAPFTIADSVTEVTQARRQKIRDAAKQTGIEISGIHWVLVKPDGLYINHVERGIREKTAEYFRQLVDFSADVGGKFMVVGSPKQRNVMEGVTPDQAWNWATECFETALDRAVQRDVTICFEALSPLETNFVNTASEAVRFARQFNDSHFKIILDVKAMCSESQPIPQIIRESWPHFAYFHANDKNLKGPGFGDVDFKPIAAALKEVGYNGFVSVEVFNFDEGPETIATKSLEYLKKTFAD